MKFSSYFDQPITIRLLQLREHYSCIGAAHEALSGRCAGIKQAISDDSLYRVAVTPLLEEADDCVQERLMRLRGVV